MTRRPDIVSDAELQARAAELAAIPPAEVDYAEGSGLLIVTAGGHRYGIEVGAVMEVVSRPVVTALPLAPSFVAGVINLRGEIVAALDLAGALGSARAIATQFAVVVRHDDLSAALLVGDVEAVDFRAGHGAVSTVNLAVVLNHPQLLPFRGTGPR